MFKIENGQIFFEDDEIGTRVFRAFALKSFIAEISKLQFETNKKTLFRDIEKKAIRKYFLFLLSRRDYLSKELKQKGQLAGFDDVLLHEVILDFKDKRWINDDVTEAKYALKRLKKGYALNQLSKISLPKDEARAIEKEVLVKLIKKKLHLFHSKDLKDRQKGYRFFLSRGYSISQIKDELAALGVSSPC